MSISQLIDCWKATKALTRLEPPATQLELSLLSDIASSNVAQELIELYAASNGGYILEGNIQLYPITGSDLSLQSASQRMRAWGWGIPSQVLVFGNNGAGGCFGLWNEPGLLAGLVVEIGEVGTLDCMAVVGTSLSSFLRGRTIYYLLLCHAPTKVYDLLEVPLDLRSTSMDDAGYELCMRRSSPELPATSLNPFDARLNAADVRRVMESKVNS